MSLVLIAESVMHEMGNTFLTIQIFALDINVAMALFWNRLFPIGCDSKKSKKERKNNHFSYFSFIPNRKKRTNKWRVTKCSTRIRFNASAIWELRLHTMPFPWNSKQLTKLNDWTNEQTHELLHTIHKTTKYQIAKKPFEIDE